MSTNNIPPTSANRTTRLQRDNANKQGLPVDDFETLSTAKIPARKPKQKSTIKTTVPPPQVTRCNFLDTEIAIKGGNADMDNPNRL